MGAPKPADRKAISNLNLYLSVFICGDILRPLRPFAISSSSYAAVSVPQFTKFRFVTVRCPELAALAIKVPPFW